jgi:hypothetical protein
MMDENKPLSENLQDHYRAISSEFAVKQNDTAANIAREQLGELLPDAIKALEQMLLSADSESVRMSGIKLVLEYTVGKPGVVSNEDELFKLITSLKPKQTEKDAKTT